MQHDILSTSYSPDKFRLRYPHRSTTWFNPVVGHCLLREAAMDDEATFETGAGQTTRPKSNPQKKAEVKTDEQKLTSVILTNHSIFIYFLRTRLFQHKLLFNVPRVLWVDVLPFLRPGEQWGPSHVDRMQGSSEQAAGVQGSVPWLTLGLLGTFKSQWT